MAPRVQSLIKFSVFLLILSCSTAQEKMILLNVKDPALNLRERKVYYHQELFSGILYELNNTDTLSKAEYKNGVLHGKCEEWYPRKNPKTIRYYSEGEKTGEHMGWWENGQKKFVITYEHDMFSGKVLEWNESGRLYHDGNFINGQEEGLQRFWRPNGKRYANYVVKNGRQYGLVGTKNCVNVKDSL